MKFNRRQFAAAIATSQIIPEKSTFAQSASPSASDVELAEASSRITSLGQYVPDTNPGEFLDFTWVDLERQVFAIAPGSEGDERSSIIMESQFANAPNFFSHLLQTRDLVGFGELDILEAISFDLPPNTLQMVRLLNDPVELVPLWREQGYEERENQYGTFWTIGENAEIDVSHPVQRVLMSQFNNIWVLDDRSMVFAAKSHIVSEVMATAAGDSPGFIDQLHPVIDALPAETTSSWMSDGTRMQRDRLAPHNSPTPLQFDDGLAESDDAVGPMPKLVTLCIVSTEGASRNESHHLESATSFIILETGNEAEQAAAVVRWRWENMRSVVSAAPLNEIVGDIQIDIVNSNIVRIASHDGANHSVFTQMVARGDHVLFAYD